MEPVPALEAPQKAGIVKLRYFTGMDQAEVAESLGISVATVQRHWAYARAWLFDAIERDENPGPKQFPQEWPISSPDSA